MVFERNIMIKIASLMFLIQLMPFMICFGVLMVMV